jgi:ankyrin repeat protein
MVCITNRSLEYNGHAKVIATLFNKGANVDAVGEKGATALQSGVYGRHVESVERLLQGLSATLSSTSLDGKTPLLREAAKSGEVSPLESLRSSTATGIFDGRELNWTIL